MKRTTLAAGLSALLASALFVPSPAQAAPAPNAGDKTLHVIQHNTDAQGPGPAMQYATASGGVDAITFQELCKGQRAAVTGAGYKLLWSQQVNPKKPGKCTKGPAIATSRGFTNPQTYTLMRRTDTTTKWRDVRVFKLLCVDLANTGVGKATVCTTHFPLDYNGKAAPSGAQNRVIVADKIKAIVNKKINAGRRVILTGDFNSFPKTAPLARFYSYAGGNGRFVEGDPKCKRKCRNMAATTDNGRKLDYFFASAPKLGGIYKSIGSAYDPKGHFPILGTATY